MKERIITKINDIEIVTVEKDEQIFVPIKPICEAIGVNYSGQAMKIREDEFLSSVVWLSHTTGADGKNYEMTCLPLQYVYGWLFTINPKNVSLDAKDKVSQYRIMCYDVLYKYFTGSMQRTIETNNAEIELLQKINSAISDEKEAKTRRRKAEEALDKLRAERLNPQPSLF